jgi:hypothetical protein
MQRGLKRPVTARGRMHPRLKAGKLRREINLDFTAESALYRGLSFAAGCQEPVLANARLRAELSATSWLAGEHSRRSEALRCRRRR